MRKKIQIILGIFTLLLFTACSTIGQSNMKKTIFITGGDFGKPFLKYVIGLTKKTNPKICFMPTASADNPYAINWFYEQCAGLPMEPHVQRVFLNSSPEQKTFEENLLDMDAIVVGGGSTLNMLAIWKAQGIDTVLKKAYQKGIILAGGSAGSLCWTQGGFTDSRPKALSRIDCLGFLPFSHCPHYHSEPTRKPLYHDAVLKGLLKAGYACDDRAGILFENEKPVKIVSANKENNCYFISVENGKVKEDMLKTEEFLE